jgi:WhiB family redox-sensing transcriptional regulator
MRHAACVEYPGVSFFPEHGDSAEPARVICRSCRVRGECLDLALDAGIRHGVWGGMSETERRAERARRRTATEVA